MNKFKIVVLTLLMLLGFYANAYASLPSEQMLIIGNKAYYFNDVSSKQDEINRQIFNNPSAIYYNDGTYIRDAFTGNTVQESMLYYTCGSQITYYKGWNSTVYLYDNSSNSYSSVNGSGAAFATVDMTVTQVTGTLSLATVKVSSVSGIPGAAYFKVYDVSRDIKSITDTIATSFVGNPTTINVYIYKTGDTATPIASGVMNMPTSYTNGVGRVISNISLTSSDVLMPRTDLGQGNTVNGGFISADDQYIYYSNTADGGKIYKRSLSGLEDYPICDDNAKYIAVLRGWVYYSNYLDKGKIYKVRTDGSGKQKISDDIGTYLNVIGDNVYYSNRSDKGRIYALNSAGVSQPLSSDEADYLNISGGSTIFYRNMSDGGKLYKMNLDGSYRQQANTNTAKYINANISSMVYYATDDGKIYRYGDLYPLNIKLVTKDKNGNNTLPVDDITTNINVVGNTIYYRSVKDGGKLYKVGTNGGVGEKIADMAVDAINVYTNNGVDTVFFVTNGKLYQVMPPVQVTDKNGISSNKLVAAAVAKPKSNVKIASIDNITKIVDDSDVGKTIDQIDLSKYIPDKVPAMMSDGSIRQLVVFWDKAKVTAKSGSYSYPGTIVGYGKTLTLTLSLSSSGINSSYVDVINNIGKNDVVQTLDNSGLISGDLLKVYDSVDAKNPIAQQKADSAGKVIIAGLDLNKSGGTLYVTVTKDKQSESKRIPVTYGIEVPAAPLGVSIDLRNAQTSQSDLTDISNIQIVSAYPATVPLNGLEYKTEKVNGDGTTTTLQNWAPLTIDNSGNSYIGIKLGVSGAQVYFRTAKDSVKNIPASAPTSPILIAPRGVAPVGINFDEQASTITPNTNTITITGTTPNMQYLISGSTTWISCSAGNTVIDGVAKNGIISVRNKATTASLPSLEATQIKITSLKLDGSNNQVFSINTLGGTLDLKAPVNVTWDVTDEDKIIGTQTSKATIAAIGNPSSQAKLTAIENGRVKVWATATDGTGIKGYAIITIGAQNTVTVQSDSDLAAALKDPNITIIKLLPRVYNMDAFDLSTVTARTTSLTIQGQGTISQIKVNSLDSNKDFINTKGKNLVLKNLGLDGNNKNIAKIINANTNSSLTVDGVTFTNIKNTGYLCEGIYINGATADIKNSVFDSSNALNHAIYVDNSSQSVNVVNNNFIANANNVSGYQYAYYQGDGTTISVKGNTFMGYKHYDNTKQTVDINTSDSAIAILKGSATIGGQLLSEPNRITDCLFGISYASGTIINTVNSGTTPAGVSPALLNGNNDISSVVLFQGTNYSITQIGAITSLPVALLNNQTAGPSSQITLSWLSSANTNWKAYLIPESTPADQCDTILELENRVNPDTWTSVSFANSSTKITAPRNDGKYVLIISDGTNVSNKSLGVLTVDATSPTLISAVVSNASKNYIILTYNEPLDSTITPTGFTLTSAPSTLSITGTVVVGATNSILGTSANTVAIPLNRAIIFGETFNINYQPAINSPSIQDRAGNKAPILIEQSVSNTVLGVSGQVLSPDLTQNDTNHVITLAFTPTTNNTWENNITTVKDGANILVKNGQYTVDAANGAININAGVLGAGSHTITVSSTGYLDSVVTQNIITPATVLSVSSPKTDGVYKTNDLIPITVTFSGNVSVTGNPKLSLSLGSGTSTADYVSGSGTNTLTFNYLVGSNDTSSDLDYINASSLTTGSGITIRNSGTTVDANITLPSPGGTGSLGANKSLVINSIISNAIYVPGQSPAADTIVLVGTGFSNVALNGTDVINQLDWTKYNELPNNNLGNIASAILRINDTNYSNKDTITITLKTTTNCSADTVSISQGFLKNSSGVPLDMIGLTNDTLNN